MLAKAWCNTGESGDCTGHTETNAVRIVSPQVDRATLPRSTPHSSAKPCVMCAGAIFWSVIGREVFGIDAVRMLAFRSERPDQRDAELSCRDVARVSPYPIECVGPALIDESSAPHLSFWKT